MYNIIKISRGGGLDLLPAEKMRKRCGSRAPECMNGILCQHSIYVMLYCYYVVVQSKANKSLHNFKLVSATLLLENSRRLVIPV